MYALLKHKGLDFSISLILFLFFRNACPVKEEVFAPYWANNTRDQVLALLNLYPFEQYIHMETCKYDILSSLFMNFDKICYY